VSGRRVTVHADGVRLSARVDGTGPPLLLLHGFTGSAEGMAPTAGGLAGAFHTVCLDLVGHGRSDAPRDPAPYTMERCAAQVAGALQALCGGSAHVLGYSMGGRVALALAALHPERVRSLVLVGARAGLADPAERAARRRADEALADRIEREGLERFVDHWMALPLFRTQRGLGEAFLARARRERLAQRPHGLAASLRGMGAGAQPPLQDRLGALRVPVLVVVGALDERFRPVARDLARRIPDARQAVIPGAGHAAHLEAPEAFRDAALDFLRRAEAARRTANGTETGRPARPSMEASCRT
jgi:2-succinyl-6-hydroxy-2,4-cyclohexadiene-1-carboxylate synthase